MNKRQFKVVLPEVTDSPDLRYYLFGPADGQSHSLYFSPTGISGQDINRSPNRCTTNAEEHIFAQVMERQSFQLAKSQEELFESYSPCELSVIIFGDNLQTKNSLVAAKPTKNSLVKQAVHSILKYTNKIQLSIELLGNTQRNTDISSVKVASYKEYLNVYKEFTDTTSQTLRDSFPLLISLEYSSGGMHQSFKIICLGKDIDEEQLLQVVSLRKSQPVVCRLGGKAKLNLIYWCPNPERKANRAVLKLLQQEAQTISFNNLGVSSFTQQTDNLYSQKTLRTQTQQSTQNKLTNKKSSSFGKKKLPSSRVCSKQRPTAKKQVLKNVQNQYNMKDEAKNHIIQVILKEKNKRIEELLKEVNIKQQTIERKQSQLQKAEAQNDRMRDKCQDLQRRQKQLVRQINMLKSDCEKAKESEEKMQNYESQIATLHGEVKQTLDKLNTKNKVAKEEIGLLKKELSDLKKKEQTTQKKHQKQMQEQQSTFTKKLSSISQQNQKHKQQLQSQIDQLNSTTKYYMQENRCLSQNNGKLSKQVKDCYESLITAQQKYGELCMKLKSLAHFKDSEFLTLTNIIESL